MHDPELILSAVPMAARFTDSDLIECVCASDLLTQKTGGHDSPDAVLDALEAAKAQDLLTIANQCRKKAADLERGRYGSSNSETNMEEWGAQLRSVADRLLPKSHWRIIE